MLPAGFQQARPEQGIQGGHLDGVDEGCGEAGLIKAREAEGVMMRQIGHDRGSQGEKAASKRGCSLKDGPQAGVHGRAVLLLQHARISTTAASQAGVHDVLTLCRARL